MTTTDAKLWANLFNRLGFHYTKAEVIRFAEGASAQEVWDKFVAVNPIYLRAAKENHLNTVDDVYSYFREASYASMRSTFPSRSRGRGILGPRILSIQQLKKQREDAEAEKAKYRARPAEIKPMPRNPKELRGKRIFHSAGNNIVYGEGIITDTYINDKREVIIVVRL